MSYGVSVLGLSVQGVYVPWGICPRVLVSGGYMSGGLCPRTIYYTFTHLNQFNCDLYHVKTDETHFRLPCWLARLQFTREGTSFTLAFLLVVFIR